MGLYQFQVYLFSSPTLTHLLLTLVFFSTFPSLASFSPLLSLHPKSFSSHLFWLIPPLPLCSFLPPTPTLILHWHATLSFSSLLSTSSSSSSHRFGDSVAAGVGMWACLTELCMRGLSNFYSDSKKRIRTSYQSKLSSPVDWDTQCLCAGHLGGFKGDRVQYFFGRKRATLITYYDICCNIWAAFFFIPLMYSKLKYYKHLYQGLIRHFLVYSPIIKALEGNYCSIHQKLFNYFKSLEQ